ncbi:hypothetical protein [Pseudomonas moraviensis]|uniref:hypothetical protein n=1 Tax=Pseudomonas moraviensis TaxID=321662 RepID=UPI0009374D69|nr:hypothetical protein [Pseudomonas moraviensis]OJT50010.1 hypothetical protein BSZ28_18430 [Pseudomonas moraviensis]
MSDSIDGAESDEDRQEFFSTEKMQVSLKRAATVLETIIDKTSTTHGITEYYRALLFVRIAFREMRQIPDVFDLACQFNINNLGAKFSESLQSFGGNQTEIEFVISYCYRFVVEFELKAYQNMANDLVEVHSELDGMFFSEYKIISRQVRYAKNHMAIHILREYINHPHMSTLKALPDSIKFSEAARVRSDEDLSKREERVSALETKLKGYENAYNFVGLYQGFSNLRETKNQEKTSTFRFLIVLGVCLIVVPIIKVLGVIGHSEDLIKELFSVAALLALELMLIYFFRIALHNFRAIKSQMLQIDLRMTLCQFINSYVEFASDARKSDKELLSRFEQIIFSGIVSEDSLIPSTFDGLEQVAKIVDSLKPK